MRLAARPVCPEQGRVQPLHRPAIVTHYLLPAGTAIVLFASLKLQPIPKLRLLLACVAATASVYTVELFLVASADSHLTFVPSLDDQIGLRPAMARLATSRNKRKYAAELARQFGSPVDIRTPQQVIADFRNNGVDAVPIVTASNHLLASQSDGSVRSIINVDSREVIPSRECGRPSHTALQRERGVGPISKR